jgi:hypothetical protein
MPIRYCGLQRYKEAALCLLGFWLSVPKMKKIDAGLLPVTENDKLVGMIPRAFSMVTASP